MADSRCMLRWATVVMLMTMAACGSSDPDLSRGLASYRAGQFEAALADIATFAERGDANAQWLLGRMYRQGEGVPVNEAAAHLWLSLAAAQATLADGDRKEIGDALAALEARMTDAEIAQARQRARDWRPKADPRSSSPEIPTFYNVPPTR